MNIIQTQKVLNCHYLRITKHSKNLPFMHRTHRTSTERVERKTKLIVRKEKICCCLLCMCTYLSVVKDFFGSFKIETEMLKCVCLYISVCFLFLLHTMGEGIWIMVWDTEKNVFVLRVFCLKLFIPH